MGRIEALYVGFIVRNCATLNALTLVIRALVTPRKNASVCSISMLEPAR